MRLFVFFHVSAPYRRTVEHFTEILNRELPQYEAIIDEQVFNGDILKNGSYTYTVSGGNDGVFLNLAEISSACGASILHVLNHAQHLWEHLSAP